MTLNLPQLLAAAVIAVASLSFVAADAAEPGDGFTAATIILAQGTRNGNIPIIPQNLAPPTRSSEKKCTEGQTSEECCKGIDYCACLGNPMGGVTPLACFSSPPPRPSGGG